MTGRPRLVAAVDLILARLPFRCALGVVRREDAKFCSRHGIDGRTRCATVIDDAEDGEVVDPCGSTITSRGGKKTCPVAEPQRGPKAREFRSRWWIDLVLRSSAHGNHLKIGELGPSGTARRASRAIHAFGSPARPVAARRGSRYGCDHSHPVRSQRPQSRPGVAPPGRGLHGPGHRPPPRVAPMLERKSRLFGRFCAIGRKGP